MNPPGNRRGGSRARAALGVAAAAVASFTGVAAPARAEVGLAPTAVAAARHPLVAVGPVGPGDPVEDAPSGHEDAEGLKLIPGAASEAPRSGGPCTKNAPVRRYDVVAINVDITLNRYLDHDPQGEMYALASEVPRVRAEEATNAAARRGAGAPAVSPGLQADAIQPLSLRVLPGECLRVQFTNQLLDHKPASFHVHGAGVVVAGTRIPAIATERRATAEPGETVTYEWMVDKSEPEATHVFHSHGDTRQQTSHGLFGALIVEPPNSTWSSPLTGKPTSTGWESIVHDPGHPDFREFVLYYHEIGDENTQIEDSHDQPVPLVDPLTNSYRPGARDINYRSEPFMNRLALQQAQTGAFDESLEYSSYAFGDPATPIMRSYLGDPVKQRIVHGGSEVFHVHHVHGGGVRWRRQPGVAVPASKDGLDKSPPLLPGASERTDSQSLGPSETFDVTDECGSGGCQQSVGDFLYHCHVAHHYFAGMWGIWRVYNTLQDGSASTDELAPLEQIAARVGSVKPAVTSAALSGSTVTWLGVKTPITPNVLPAFVERQLPPPGLPRGYDAAVLDWKRDGDVYLNEPETSASWPAYQARAPGTRPPLLFDPLTAKLAYPFLQPHLFKRPPFAPNHGPAPYLDPVHDGTALPDVGANGPASTCPSGTRAKQFAVNAIDAPVTYNATDNLVDPAGKLFVLRNQEDQARRDNALRVPLTIRANAGEDCVDVLLRSELSDDANTPFSKVSLHMHFVQFDVQASDGVDTGFNYEQSVRPYGLAGEKLTAPARLGASFVRVANAARFQVGIEVGVGVDQSQTFEVRKITAIRGTTLVFDQALEFGHNIREIVSTEFVRYRYFPDAQFGTSYFHDHVNGVSSWEHGLMGALVAEPPGSTYTDPHSGEELLSGAIADIHTNAAVSADVKGSFRELTMFTQDDSPVNHIGRSTGSAFNLRAEPLDARGGDPSALFSSHAHGEPATPLLDTYLGDPIVVRDLVGATNEVHTWHVDGHWFRAEPFSATSPPISTIHIGISERYDLVIPKAGGPQHMPGDYLYYSGRPFKLEEGSWGLIRVHGAGNGAGLMKLPGHATIPQGATRVCPDAAPVRHFDVHAIDVPLPMLEGQVGKAYVLGRDKRAVVSGKKQPEPLVLHVSVGDCVALALTNDTTAGPVSYHCDLLAFDPSTSAGVGAGNEPDQAVAPGRTRTYTYYASPEVGETAALGRDWGNVLANPGFGLYAAIVVGPKGARYSDARSGASLSKRAATQAVVAAPHQAPYRDFTVFTQDEDPAIGSHRMPYSTAVRGTVGLNYAHAPPFEGSLGDAAEARPPTPTLEAFAGDPVKLHVLAPWSEQGQVFSVEGHQWPQEPGERGTNMLSSVQLGGLESTTLNLVGGAGGPAHLAGDYIYGDHREAFRQAGLWGVLRVWPAAAHPPGLRRLPGRGRGLAPVLWVLAAVVALVVFRIRRRKPTGEGYDARRAPDSPARRGRLDSVRAFAGGRSRR